jgi:hypothetical protein
MAIIAKSKASDERCPLDFFLSARDPQSPRIDEPGQEDVGRVRNAHPSAAPAKIDAAPAQEQNVR